MMNSTKMITIILYAIFTAVLVVLLLKILGYENSVTIAGGAAGGVAGAIAAGFKQRKATDLKDPT